MSVVGYRLWVVGCRLSVVGCRLSVVGCRMSDVGCRLSEAGWPVAGGGLDGVEPARDGQVPDHQRNDQRRESHKRQSHRTRAGSRGGPKHERQEPCGDKKRDQIERLVHGLILQRERRTSRRVAGHLRQALCSVRGSVRGMSSHVRPLNSRPVRFLKTPPHCLKKNFTFALSHCS